MYGHIFDSLWDGSLRGRSAAQLVFVYLISHSSPEGTVEIVRQKIADDTGLGLDQVNAAIEELESPDPDSRRPDLDGRRLARLDERRSWGWLVVNREHYAGMHRLEDRKRQNRENVQRYRERHPSSPVINGNQPSSDVSTQEQEQEQEQKDTPLAAPAADSDRKVLVKATDLPRYSEPFARFWENYAPCPRRTKKPQAWAEWRRASGDLISDQILAGLDAYKRSEQWRTGFMPEPARWLKGRVWEDADGLGEVPQVEESDGERANRRGQDTARALIERMTGRRPQW